SSDRRSRLAEGRRGGRGRLCTGKEGTLRTRGGSEGLASAPATRRATLTGGVALMGALAAACTPGAAGQPPPGYSGEEAQVRVQGGISTATGEHWDEAMAEFRAKFPKIKTTWEANPPSSDGLNWQAKLKTTMVAGTAPDIFGPWGNWFAEFLQAGQLENVEQYTRRVKASEISDFAKWQWDAFAAFAPGVRVGLPRYINIIMLYYNKDLFDEAGVRYPNADWTMDTYREALVRLSRDTDGDGRRDQWGGKLSYSSWDRFQRYVLSWGGHTVDPKDRSRCMLGAPEAQAAMQWLRDRIWKDNSMAQVAQLEALVNDTGNYVPFYQRKIAMSEEGISSIGRRFAVNMEEAGNLNWSIMHVPKGPAIRNTLGTTDGWGMWKGTKNKQATWEVLWYLAGPAFQRTNVVYSGQMPVRFSVQEDYKRILRQQWPTLEQVDLDVALEAQKLGYPRDNENFTDQQRAMELIDPALDRVFDEGTEPVRVFVDLCQQVSANQPRTG
ncbi:MAG: extracellular solute-binding protein, partial [Chloroflexota bacterium]